MGSSSPFLPNTFPGQSLIPNDVVLIFNFEFLVPLIYCVFYFCLHMKAGSVPALLCMVCWVDGNSVARWLGFSFAWKVLPKAQIVCWMGQFIGHGVFEKRAPALLDNLVHAFVMAPFFVTLAALQFFGYEPYRGFHALVKAKIDAEISEWQEKKQKLVS